MSFHNSLLAMGSMPQSLAISELKADLFLVLGSGSATRRLLLEEMGFKLGENMVIITADIDERAIRDSVPEQLVYKLGHAKADAIIAKIQSNPDLIENALISRKAPRNINPNSRPEVLLLTGDQVVVHQDRILEKPTSAEEVFLNCKSYSESPASTVGSIVVTDIDTNQRFSNVDKTEIYFRPIPDDIIHKLIEEGEVFYCAGGLRIEDPLVSKFVDHVVGGIDSVMGLNKAVAYKLVQDAVEARRVN